MWCGLSERGVRHRVAQGRLTRVARAVYSLSPVIGDVASRLAAVLRAGAARDPRTAIPAEATPEAAIAHLTTLRSGIACSHWTAAHALGIARHPPPRPQVVVLDGSYRPAADIDIHRTRRLLNVDVTSRDGVPVTTAARTIIDIARAATPKVVRRLIREAQYRQILSSDEWMRAVLRHQGHPGLAVVMQADPQIAVRLTGDGPAGGDLAVLLAELPLPPAIPQYRVPVGGEAFRIDHAYPDVKLAVEGDGRREHTSPTAIDDDHRRTLLLGTVGWLVVRASQHRLVQDRTALGRQIVATHTARVAALRTA